MSFKKNKCDAFNEMGIFIEDVSGTSYEDVSIG